MSLVDGNGLSAADIAAVTGNNNGFGFGGDGAWWMLVLFLFAFMGNGWGNGYGAGNGASMQMGFDQSAVMAGINGLQSSMSNGFADAAVAQCNQTASILQGFNAIGLQMANNRFDVVNSITNTGYNLQNQICGGFRDVIDNQKEGFQMLADKMCQQEIDALKTQNANLQTQLNMQALASSTNAQTAQLIQDNNAQTAALINRIAPSPIPSYQVANPYVGTGCLYNSGCPCGSMT